MRRIIKLTERDLSKLVRRVIREQEQDVSDLPTCNSKMVNDGNPGSSSEMSGSYTKITYNGSVPPQYQGYTVHTVNGPFCFVPTGGVTPPRPQPVPPRPQPVPPRPQPVPPVPPQPGPPQPKPRPLD